MNQNKEISTHLEYLGYEQIKSKEPDYLLFHKNSFPLFGIYCFEGGSRCYARYELNEFASIRREDLLLFINKLNMESYVATYSYDEEQNCIVFTSNIVGEYNKKDFTQFINLWEFDVENRLNNYPSESKLYLYSEKSMNIHEDQNQIYA